MVSDFKTYNIIEYKSSKDGLKIDDYIKNVGYAYLYKGLGAAVDAVPLSKLIATIVRETELFKKIQSEGGSIEEKYTGVYYINGFVSIPTHFILTSSLSKEFHVCLRVLNNNACEEDVKFGPMIHDYMLTSYVLFGAIFMLFLLTNTI